MIDKIQNYYTIVKNVDLIERFDYLVHILLCFPAKFESELAEELLYIIENCKEDLEDLAHAFRDSGESIKSISDHDWEKLEKIVEGYL